MEITRGTLEAEDLPESEEKQKNRADVSSDSESDTEMFEYVVEQHIGGNPDTSKHSQNVKDSREE